MKKIVAAIFALAFLALPALAGEAPQVVRSDLAGKAFVLKVVDGVPYTGEKPPTIEFGENLEISGAVCNRYRGAGVLDGSLFTVRQAASTRMACPNEDLAKLETLFLTQLEEGVLLALHGNRLTMTGGKSVMVFELQGAASSGPKIVISKAGSGAASDAPAPAAAAPTGLAGGKFILASVNGKTVDTGGKAHLEFADNYFLTGGLCSFFRGNAVFKDGVLTVANLAWAGQVCGNLDLHRTEETLVGLLREGVSASLAGGVLTLKGDGLELTFTAAASAPAAEKPAAPSAPAPTVTLDQLLGKKYILKLVDGKEFKAEYQPQIEFLPGARLTGRLCNGFMGSVELKGDLLFLKAAATTLMLCEDGNLNKVEGAFHEMMQAGAAVGVSGRELTLKGANMTLVFAEK